jgi:NADH:ubiquinone oxidoreductase subunit 6 (subunit J)
LDLVLTIVFYVSSILAVAGALATALLPAGVRGLAGLLAVAVGTAGVLVSLSAGFVALVALVCLGAAALLLGRQTTPVTDPSAAPRTLSAQIGAVAAGLLVLVLVYVALRGTYVAAPFTGDGFGISALGRAFFGRDALAMEAVGAMLLVALAFGAAALGRRS